MIIFFITTQLLRKQEQFCNLINTSKPRPLLFAQVSSYVNTAIKVMNCKLGVLIGIMFRIEYKHFRGK